MQKISNSSSLVIELRLRCVKPWTSNNNLDDPRADNPLIPGTKLGYLQHSYSLELYQQRTVTYAVYKKYRRLILLQEVRLIKIRSYNDTLPTPYIGKLTQHKVLFSSPWAGAKSMYPDPIFLVL